ncbi:MAG: hypothetical protein ACRD3T_21130 [Terriglobia bacterium]
MSSEFGRGTLLALVVCLSLARPAPCQQGAYWKAEIRESDYAFGLIKHIYPCQSVYPGAGATNYKYDVYQALGENLRKELAWTDVPRAGTINPPMDITLIDFSGGYRLVYDKGGKTAERSSLKIVGHPTPLAPMQLLGHRCAGKEYQWTDRRGESVRVKEWVTADADFKLPLLQFVYTFNHSGALRVLTTQVVTALQMVPSLASSLFEPPAGLAISSVPPTPIPFL